MGAIGVLGADAAKHRVLLSDVRSPGGTTQYHVACLDEACGWSNVAVTFALATLWANTHLLQQAGARLPAPVREPGEPT